MKTPTPTTYVGHSVQGNSLDLWPVGGGWKTRATGDLEKYLDEVAVWLMDNHSDLKMYYMMWKNRIWNPSEDAHGAWWDC
eukprot:scaffold34604_cov164-Amphora_coffeaeformis.AAC.9